MQSKITYSPRQELRSLASHVRLGRGWTKLWGIALLLFPGAMACPDALQAQTGQAEAYLNKNCCHWTQQQKLFALSEFWSEVRQNFIYIDRVGPERWDSLYQALIPQTLATKNDCDFTLLMQRFCGFLKDGHTELWVNTYYPFTTNYFSDGWALELELVDGKVVVAAVNKERATLVPLGTEVTEVDGLPIAQALEKKELECFASTPQVRSHQAARSLLEGTIYTPHALTFVTPSGKTVKVTLCNEYREEYSNMEMERVVKTRMPNFKLEWYPGDVAYLRIGTFMMKTGPEEVQEGLANAFPEMRQRAKKLIIDLRHNSGGNSNFACKVLSYFVPDSTVVDGKWRTRIHNAAYASWGANLQPKDTVGDEDARVQYENSVDVAKSPFKNSAHHFRADRPRLVVPTLILTDYATNSSCENFLVAADGQPHIKRMGEASSGSTGNPLMIQLLKGMDAKICTKEDVFPDGRVFVGVGIKPDYEVHQTLKDYLHGHDTVLGAALKHFGSKMKKVQ
jgi:carboxyl-terminal processing protease